MSSLNVMIGADPEFFLRSRETKEFVSAHNIVPGTKVKPHPLKNGGFIQADGTAVEFNIKPAKTGKEFAEYIKQALEDIHEFVDPNKFEYAFLPSVQYNKEYFATIPEEAKALGCDPDFNAYTLEQNPIYQPPEGVRTGSGHLHIGFSEDEDTKDIDYVASCARLVKFLDSTLIPKEYTWCKDTIRPTLYGKAGNFRPKSYGLEYRTLGNAWLNHSKTQLCDLFNTTQRTVLALYEQRDKALVYSTSELLILNKKHPSGKYYSSFRFNNLSVN